MKVLELFAGTRSIGKAFEKRGHEVFSVDWDRQFQDIDLYADISKLTSDDIIRLFGKPDVVWASFDCTSYSYALNHLIEAWNDCNDILLDARIDGDLLDDIIVEDYPFDRSLEEMDIDVSNWLDDCITRTVYRQSKFPD